MSLRKVLYDSVLTDQKKGNSCSQILWSGAAYLPVQSNLIRHFDILKDKMKIAVGMDLDRTAATAQQQQQQWAQDLLCICRLF